MVTPGKERERGRGKVDGRSEGMEMNICFIGTIDLGKGLTGKITEACHYPFLSLFVLSRVLRLKLFLTINHFFPMVFFILIVLCDQALLMFASGHKEKDKGE